MNVSSYSSYVYGELEKHSREFSLDLVAKSRAATRCSESFPSLLSVPVTTRTAAATISPKRIRCKSACFFTAWGFSSRFGSPWFNGPIGGTSESDGVPWRSTSMTATGKRRELVYRGLNHLGLRKWNWSVLLRRPLLEAGAGWFSMIESLIH